MHVTLISDLLVQPLSGVGRYSYELATQLQKNGRVASVSFVSCRGVETWGQIEQRLSCRPLLQSSSKWSWPQLRSHLVNTSMGSLCYSTIARAQLNRVDSFAAKPLLHAPTLLPLPIRLKAPKVVTVHDLSHRINRNWHPEERARRLDQALRTLASADAVIAVSQATADVLVQQNWVCANAVHVVHNGVSPLFSALATNSASSSRRQVLCVGTIEPRKNIESLLRAYATLPKKMLREHPLLLIGEYGWRSSSLHALIGEKQNQGWLRYVGYVSDTDLALEYGRSRLCVYPSLHEGFGLPVLEALAAGTPVIAGDHSSIGEVAGGHARLLSSVTDIDEMREAILAELQSPWDTEAAVMRATHAARFTWEAAAAKTIDAYAHAIATR